MIARSLTVALLLASLPAAAGPFLAPQPSNLHGILLGRDQLASLAPAAGLEQTESFVIPQRPGKNQVRWYEFRWRHHDYLDEDGSAGVRFYWYDRELPVARIAAALVRQQWAYLEGAFNYKPTVRVPYILYNSHREFEATNVFFVNEYILGVTSPQDLRMTLPYWGERERFREVSTHEMTHQFTIQKMLDRAAAAGVETPINAFPLWFIEGIAEYYAHGGIDAETDMFLRDIVLNPRGDKGYEAPGIMEDRPGDYIFTYKLGQARLAFLADHYGERLLQALLDQSPRLAGAVRRGEDKENFQQLLARLAGEPLETIDARWKAWLKQRVYPAFLEQKQQLADFNEVKLDDELDTFDAAPGGNVLLYRGVERLTGRAKLVLVDRRDPSSARRLAIDSVPGTESLHPVLRTVAAVGKETIAYVAQSGQADVLFTRTYKVREDRDAETGQLNVSLEVSGAKSYPLASHGLIEAGSLALSPDGQRLALVGFDEDGKEDIWVTEFEHPERLRRLTDDLFSEQDLAWGADGIYFASDATETGRYNLFRLDPDTGTRTRLTDAPFDQRAPQPLPAGDVAFASAQKGEADLWILHDGRVRRVTDFATGLGHPQLSPVGFFSVGFNGGRFHLFEVKQTTFTNLDEGPAMAADAPPDAKPREFPVEPLPVDAPRYDPFSAQSWRVEGGGAAIGGAGFGVGPVGQGGVELDDVLRDRTLLVNLAVYGSFSFTDALAFYLDRARRTTLGFALFHTFEQLRDVHFPSVTQCGQTPASQASNATYIPGPACEVFYLAREFGAEGFASYPFNLFSRLDAALRVQGVSRTFLESRDANLYPTDFNLSEFDDLAGVEPEAQAELSYGYDTTRFAPGGAIGGASALISLGVNWLPLRTFTSKGTLAGQNGATVVDQGLSAFLQEDAIATLRLIGRSKLTARVASGVSGGSRFARQFFVSSFDNLRGYHFGDLRLLGTYYYVGQAEVSVPLDVLIRFAFFENVSGIVAFDFGGVGQSLTPDPTVPHHLNALAGALARDAWDARTLAFVVGTNLGLGPFQLRVHFARPIGIGSPGSNYMVCQSNDGGQDCANQTPGWVTNISLNYAYF